MRVCATWNHSTWLEIATGQVRTQSHQGQRMSCNKNGFVQCLSGRPLSRGVHNTLELALLSYRVAKTLLDTRSDM
jgi:hypothetical protein